MRIEDLEEYKPLNHGEHGVDAVIHNIASFGDNLHEVACEPPGGSWNQIDIIHPGGGGMFRWDNLPRHPSSSVKKPDGIIQTIHEGQMEILLIESKKRLNDLDPIIGKKMKEFFNGNDDFVGVRERPAWHRRSAASGKWQVLPKEAPAEVRFWLRDYDRISIFTGFAFATFGPPDAQSQAEAYDSSDDSSDSEINRRLSDALSDSDIDVALTVQWGGRYEYPTLYVKATEEFRKSLIWTGLVQNSKNRNLDIELL